MASRSSRPSKTHYGSSSSVSSSRSYSTTGSDSSMDVISRPVASVEVLRCLRCARAVEITSTDDVRTTGMVRIGTNIYYCESCAKKVGYK